MNMEMNGLFRKKNTVYDSVSFFVFIVGLLFVPLTVYPLLDFSLDISKRFLFLFTVGLAFIFWLIGRIASRNVSLPRHYAYVPLGGFLLSALISSLFSGQIRNAIVGFNFDTGTLVFLLALSLAFFLSSMFFHSTKKFLNFYFGLFFVFLIVFVFQVARYLFGNFTPWDIFDYGTTNMIGRWNEFGVFAGFIGLSALIFLEFLSLRGVKLAKVFMTVILILALMAVAVVNFYSVWIVLAVFSFLTYVYYLAFVLPSAGRRAGVLRPSLVVLIVALLFVFLGKAPNPYETRDLSLKFLLQLL